MYLINHLLYTTNIVDYHLKNKRTKILSRGGRAHSSIFVQKIHEQSGNLILNFKKVPLLQLMKTFNFSEATL